MKRFGLIGNRINYSLSPLIHGEIFSYFGLEGHCYSLIDIEPEKLEESLSTLLPSQNSPLISEPKNNPKINPTNKKLDDSENCSVKGTMRDGDATFLSLDYNGFNVTVPYKNRVFKYVDYNYSPIDAINVIAIQNGKKLGYNTDITGFSHSFLKAIGSNKHTSSLPSMLNDGQSLDVLVIGSGGGAEAVVYALKHQNYNIRIKARNQVAVFKLVNKYSLNEFTKDFVPYIIVNASGQPFTTALNDVNIENLAIYYDLSYCFKEQASYFSDKNIGYVDGLDMLIYQAIYGAKLLYGVDIKDKVETLHSIIQSKLIKTIK